MAAVHQRGGVIIQPEMLCVYLGGMVRPILPLAGLVLPILYPISPVRGVDNEGIRPFDIA